MCRQAVAITGRGRKQMVHILRGQRCWGSKGVGSDRMQYGRHVCLSTSLRKCREVQGRSLSRRCLSHASIAGIQRLSRLGLPNAMSTAIAWHPCGVWRHGGGCGQHGGGFRGSDGSGPWPLSSCGQVKLFAGLFPRSFVCSVCQQRHAVW